MAHEVERMMYVGQEPWHGLGHRLEDPPSIDEAIRLAGLDWTVRLEQLYLKDGRSAPSQATVRDSDNSILGAVGPGYTLLQNADAFRWFEPFLAAGAAHLHTAGSLRSGKRVWVLAKVAGDPLVIVPKADDKVDRYILLSNSHDGTLAVRVGYTPIRVVCANTLAMSMFSGASKLIRVRHTSNVVAALDGIRDIMSAVNADFEASAEQYRFLASRGCALADLKKYVRIVFKVEAKERESKIEGQVLPLFERGFGQDLPGVRGTWWAAYNAANEYLNHIRSRTQDARLDSLWFGDSARLNKDALDIAMRFAA